MATAEGAYRCAECGSWRHLTAYAAAVVGGPLNERGELAAYDSIDECFVHEDSICCTRHMLAPVEMFLGGRWCRWWSCPRCHGKGTVGEGRGYPCPDGIRKDQGIAWAGGRQGPGIHEGWLPAREAATLRAAENREEVH